MYKLLGDSHVFYCSSTVVLNPDQNRELSVQQWHLKKVRVMTNSQGDDFSSLPYS
jgi:hypothetical protein